MFDAPTVLVLGAGASAPFNYPLGATLIEKIIEGLNGLSTELNRAVMGGLGESDLDFLHKPYKALVAYALAHKPPYLPPEFCKSIAPWKTLAEELHHTSHQSIDEFARVNPKMRNAVRLLIATELGRHTYESSSVRNNDLRMNAGLTANARSTWYGKLVSALRRGCVDASSFHGNQLSVVTFNYDRSLDLFLERELPRGEIYSSLEARSIVPIVHVHGALDIVNPQDGRLLAYHYAESLVRSAESFSLIDDARARDHDLMVARTFVHEAEHIIVLGFDFHPSNVRLLRLDEPSVASKIRTLNYAGSPGFRSRAIRANVVEDNIWGRGGRVYEIAEAIDDGLLEL